MGDRIMFTWLVLALVTSSACGGGSDEPKSSDDASSVDSPSAGSGADPTHPFAGEASWLAYQTNRAGGEGVWLIHPDGSQDHQVATDAPGQEQLLPDWFPDGTRIAFTTRGGKTEPLYEYDLNTRKSRLLFDCEDPCIGDDEPAVSPDGSQVAFIRALGPITQQGLPRDCALWVGDLASGSTRPVTSNTKPPCDREYNPRWSPDASHLTYWRISADGKTAVYTITATGENQQQLTDPSLVAGEADWSPDGKWIVFATHPLAQFDCCEISNLYRIHPNGKGAEQLTQFDGPDLRATQPRYSPDGEWIVFTAVTPTSRTLSAMPADGGKPVQMTTSGIYTHGTWQPHD